MKIGNASCSIFLLFLGALLYLEANGQTHPDAVYPIPANVGVINSGGIDLFTGSVNDTITLMNIPARTFKYRLQALYNSRTAGLISANSSNYTFNVLGGYGWKMLDYPKIVQDGSNYFLVDGYASYSLQGLSQNQAFTAGGKYYLWKILQVGSGWAILTEDGKRYVFDQPGISIGANRTVWNFSKMQEMQWKDSLSFVYSSTGVLNSIANTLGDTLLFQYDTVGTSTQKYLKTISHHRTGVATDSLVFQYSALTVGGTNYYVLSVIKTIQQIAPQIYAENQSGYKFTYFKQGAAPPMGGASYVGGLLQKIIPTGAITTFSYIATNGGSSSNPLNYSVVQYAVNVGYENTSGDTLDANTYTSIEYDSTNVTLDASRTYLQYNYAQVFPGGRYFTGDTTKAHPYGNAEYYLFNGLPPSRLWDVPPGIDSTAAISSTLRGYNYQTLINSDTTVHDKNIQNASSINYWGVGYADSVGGLHGAFPRLDRSFSQLYGIGEWTLYKYGQYGLPTAMYTSRRNPEPNSPLLNKDSLATLVTYAYQIYPALASDSLHIINAPARFLFLVQEDLQGPFVVTACQGTQWTQWDKRGNPAATQGAWAPWRTIVMRDSSANPDSLFTATATSKQWIIQNLINKRYPSGAIADSSDINHTVASTLFSSRNYGNYPVASFVNATIDSIADGRPPNANYYGFEPYEGPGSTGWSMGQGSHIVSTNAHTGENSFSGVIKNMFAPLLKAPRTFIFSAWCWVGAAGDSCNLTIYNMQSQILGSKTLIYGMGTPVWIYMELTVMAQPGQSMTPKATTSGGALIDDMRFGPVDALFSALVYDMDRKFITAELGTNGETTYRVHNRFNEQIALVGPGSLQQIKNVSLPYNSRKGNRVMHGIDQFDPQYPNMLLQITARNGGTWDGFQYQTSTNFPPANLVNMQIQNQWLRTTRSPGSATFAGDVSSKNFSLYIEATSNNLGQQQEMGFSVQLDSLNNQDSVLSTKELRLVFTRDSVKLYRGARLYTAHPLTSPPSSTSLLLTVSDQNYLIAYLAGRYIFQYEFLSGAIHGPVTLVSSNVGGSFDNFMYVDQSYVSQQTYDALNQPRQLLTRKSAKELYVSEIIYGGPLNLPVAQTKPGLLGGSNANDLSMSYKSNFAKGFNYDSMSIDSTSTIASAAGYNNPFDISVRYVNSPLLQLSQLGGGGQFTAGEKGNQYSTFTYQSVVGSLFDYYSNDLLTRTKTHPNGAQHITFNNREGVLFAEAHIAKSDTLKTQYEYDRGMRLKRTYLPNYYNKNIAGNSNFILENGYDFVGSKIIEKTPDAGAKRFVYDPAGRLRFMVDSTGMASSPNIIVYQKYDLLNRMTEEGYIQRNWNRDTLQSYADTSRNWPSVPTTWKKKYVYDGDGYAPSKGRLTSVLINSDADSSAETIEKFKYDIYGHVAEKSLTVLDFDTLSRKVSYQYDLLGNMTNVNFPGTTNPGLLYSYNESGQVTAIGNPGNPMLFATYTYANGQMNENLNNNNLTRAYNYTQNGWLSETDDFLFNESLYYAHKDSSQDSVHYDGNITQLTNLTTWNMQSTQANFKYDHSGRLKVADYGASNPWSLGIKNPTTYDNNGNISVLQYGTNAPYNLQYNSGSNQLKTIQGFQQNFGYDGSGNIISVPYGVTNILYDPVSRMTTSMTNRTTTVSFQYGGKNQRVLKSISSQGRGSGQILYVHGMNDYPLMEITKDSLGRQSTVYYVYGPTGLIALQQGSSRYFVLKDHLKSVRAILDTNNAVKASFSFSSFGSLMNSTIDTSIGSLPLRYRFTGQEYDSETGLYNYRARMYDPGYGRFYSPDPRMQYPSPYEYAQNNPISYIDPTGTWGFWSVVAVIAVAVAVVAVAVIAAPLVLSAGAVAALGITGATVAFAANVVLPAAIIIGSAASAFAYVGGEWGSGSSSPPIDTRDDGITLPVRINEGAFGISGRKIQGYYSEIDLTKAKITVPNNDNNVDVNCPKPGNETYQVFPYRVIDPAPGQYPNNPSWRSYYPLTLTINSNFFDVSTGIVNPYDGYCTNILGVSVSNGVSISDWQHYPAWTDRNSGLSYNLDALVFYKDGSAYANGKKADIIRYAGLSPTFLSTNVQNAVGGIFFLRSGTDTSYTFGNVVSRLQDKGRTAVGVSDDGKKLLILEVDSKIPESDGVKFSDMVTFFKGKGYNNVMNLDGDGSSAFYYQRNSNIFSSSPMDTWGSSTRLHRPIPNFLGFK